MMEVWDAKNKQIVLVPAAKSGPDRITLTIRVHDAAEKKDANKSSRWVTMIISREDIELSQADFMERYIKPALPQFDPILQLK